MAEEVRHEQLDPSWHSKWADICMNCNCIFDDHFEPNWDDPETLYENEAGKVNHCESCWNCYEPKYDEAS